LILFAVLVIGVSPAIQEVNANEQDLPAWLKHIAQLWANDDVTNGEYIETIQWLVDNRHVIVNNTDTDSGQGSTGTYHNTNTVINSDGSIASLEQITTETNVNTVTVLDSDGNIVSIEHEYVGIGISTIVGYDIDGSVVSIEQRDTGANDDTNTDSGQVSTGTDGNTNTGSGQVSTGTDGNTNTGSGQVNPGTDGNTNTGSDQYY